MSKQTILIILGAIAVGVIVYLIVSSQGIKAKQADALVESQKTKQAQIENMPAIKASLRAELNKVMVEKNKFIEDAAKAGAPNFFRRASQGLPLQPPVGFEIPTLPYQYNESGVIKTKTGWAWNKELYEKALDLYDENISSLQSKIQNLGL